LVVADVSFQNLVEGTQKPLEALPVESDDLAVGSGDDVGCSWLIPEKGQLTEVITWLILHNTFIWINIQSGLCMTLYKDVKIVALISLLDDNLTFRNFLLFDAIS
jgi:hypothetical protein